MNISVFMSIFAAVIQTPQDIFQRKSRDNLARILLMMDKQIKKPKK